MVSTGVLPGAAAPKSRFARFFFGFAKKLNRMSISGALKSANASEFVLPCPAGEDNWKSRLTFCQLLADAIDRSPNDAPAGISSTLEPFYNNLLDCAICERTTLSIQACRLLGAIPKVIGKDIHQHLDRFLPTLIRQCASTKQVAQKSASAAITSIIYNSPYNGRLLYHVCQAFEDKYTAPKLYAPGWLKLIIENYHGALSPDRDYYTINRAINIGLVDADNNVRVSCRATFWTYHKIDPTGAEELVTKLHGAAQTALMNDPNNPEKATKSKGKHDAESGHGAIVIKRQSIRDRIKQKAAEQKRVVSTKTVASDDLPFGPVDLGDDHHSSHSHKSSVVAAPAPEGHIVVNKTTSRPIAIHKKGSSHDGQVPAITKKASTIDIAANKPKKTGSTDSLRTSQNKKFAAAPTPAESSTARPLLSAPVRRHRIVATPINAAQPSSRPASRAGASQPTMPNIEPSLRSAASNRELRSAPADLNNTAFPPVQLQNTTNVSKPSKKIPRSELSSPVVIPSGKENANIYNPSKHADRTSPVRLTPLLNRKDEPISPPKEIPIKDDGLTKEQRLSRQMLDKEIKEMLPMMPFMVAEMEAQPENKATQMYHAYPTLNHDGQIENARRALEKALEYLNKDALDQMGFRKLRKLLETFGAGLIIDQALYDQLFSELLPRLGSFDELLTQPLEEVSNERHPRYIRSAILTMINVLILDFPFEWSYQYQGPALASAMIARCTYSANCDWHEGAHAVHNMSIVNQITTNIMTIVNHCMNPLEVLESILQVLAAGEDFLMRNAPHDSETQKSWASFNPYSKINRLRSENASGIFHLFPKNLESFENIEPKPLPMKLPLLMETGLKIIKMLIQKAEKEKIELGMEREDVLADLARHLLSSYSVIIRRQVMEYCQVLYKQFESNERFWAHFESDSERNLLHYYLEK